MPSGSPVWKLYDPEGRYKASAHDIALLASCVNFYGSGSTIRYHHKFVVWTEGVDGVAWESYDVVAEKAHTEVAKRTDRRGVVHRTVEGVEKQHRYMESDAYLNGLGFPFSSMTDVKAEEAR